MSGYFPLPGADAMQDGDSRAYDVNGQAILLCKSDGAFYAVENRCSHALQALQGGAIRKCYIFCPVHGARFDLRDGSTAGTLTNKPIRTFAVRARGRSVEVLI
ncbi:Rieske (2Fe-2S) protein [Rhizorhapis sp. SPR117]|uniref:Rieske (2Fe-2S) protein n=1 Tax=Rhizorhapis sp. SPR117 TaxID=2912611 RepID=UPI00403E4D86